jgi:hypothetical protein
VATQTATQLTEVETRVATQTVTQLASVIAPLASLVKTMESSILAELREFKGQLGNLRMDVNDHEKPLNHLNSKFLKQDALLTGYKATNDKLVTSLHSDVNDACAKFPSFTESLWTTVCATQNFAQ